MKEIINLALNEYSIRYKKISGRKPSEKYLSRQRKKILTLWRENPETICYQLNEKKTLSYFYYSEKEFYPPLKKEIYIYPLIYCDNDKKIQRKFQKKLFNDVSNKTMNVLLRVFADDEVNCLFFNRKSSRTVYQTIGNVKKGLKALSSIEIKKIKVLKMKPTQLERAVSVELAAHRLNSTSMMHNALQSKTAKSFCRPFLNGLIKDHHAFVLSENKQYLGHFGFFANTKSREASIATVSIDPKFQNKGYAKTLYWYLLKELYKNGVIVYEGQSSTDRVLSLFKLLDRRIFIKDFLLKHNN